MMHWLAEPDRSFFLCVQLFLRVGVLVRLLRHERCPNALVATKRGFSLVLYLDPN